MKRRITAIVMSCFLLFPVLLMAQELQVSGIVTLKSDGSPLPGVTVSIKGAKKGTSTDVSGKYTLSAPVGSVLIFSQLGLVSQSVTVSNQTINLSLEEDSKALEEVVVIGYGTQKKSLVTGATSGVRAAELENQQITRIEQALQGRTSGITVAQNSGAPGSAAQIRIRGITTINTDGGANQPLWVVDGIVVDNGGIDYLNSNDIESVEVLKDAASAAIYGARSASGVVLVTTKKGKAGSLRLNYNAYVGTQAPSRKLDLLNATQYATLRNEAYAVGGGAAALPYATPASLGTGTDWQSAIFNTSAMIQDHQVSISGGSDKSTFYTSFGLLDQQGIVASDISYYKRYNVRLNTTHKIKSWLTVGNTLGYSHIKNQGGVNTNSEFGGPLSSAINLDPITPLVETDPVKASAYNANAIKDVNGYPYGISNVGVQEMTNPLAFIQTQMGNYSHSDNIVGSVFGSIQPIKGLTLGSTLSGKLAFWGNESFTPIFYLGSGGGQSNPQTSLFRQRNQGINWNIENTATYAKKINKHDFTFLIGQGAYSDNNTSRVQLNFQNVPGRTFDEATFNIKVTPDLVTGDAGAGIIHTVSSLYSRLIYNFDEKYLLNVLIRRDGSSRFGANYKYGYFPSASVGWVPSSEGFWPKNNYVNTLKVRGSYGITGSDNIGNFRYLSTVGGGRNYVFGQDVLAIGWSPDAPANPDLKWEETSQLNIGLDATFLNDWTFGFDYYNKKTSGILRPIALPGYGGFNGSPIGNVADMTNKGLEFELGYQKRFGNLNLNIRGNASNNKNEITYLGVTTPFISGAGGIQNLPDLQRTQVGQPYNSFYGYTTAGIFQNQAEVNAYTGAKGLIQPKAVPGDFKFVDSNGDGAITGDDRSFMGNAIPTFNYGLNIDLSYKAFDFQVFGQGSAGNTIFQGLRRLDVGNANWSTKALGRWTGEGSSNSYPKISTKDDNGNFSKLSDFYLEKGDFFKIRTLQIGYSLPKSLISKASLQKVRVYLNSNNLMTFTKYTGYDPEIGGNPDTWGIDAGIYPQARTFSFGINVGL